VIDRLPDPLAPIEVRRYEGVAFGTAAERGPREPHRHDYHELIWTRSGEGTHLIDGRPFSVAAGTLTLIGRGQVHVFEHARDFHGAVVRFGEQLLHAGPSTRAHPGWLLSARGERVVEVPASDAPRLEAAIATLAAESRRPPDACSIDVQRHLLSVLLLWVERWYDERRIEDPDPDDAAVRLQRRFMQLLERDFARHHDAGHYADALAVPPATLSRALSEVTGKGTKELVTDRVMLEGARLLGFTDMSVNEVAFATGFDDQLYFSRAFKRHQGVPPSVYRARVRGDRGA
jgi:AraC family transcriptional regulator, transcriptional activator of pobA